MTILLGHPLQIRLRDLDTPNSHTRKHYFPLNLRKGKLTKKCRGAKLQVFLYRKKITGRSPLRFLGKCAGRNLISARSLYPFDDAIGQTIGLPPDKTSFLPGSGNQRTEDR